MINFLGEHYKSALEAEKAVSEYKALIDELRSRKIRASLTIKPSQFGFNAEDVGDRQEFCSGKLREVIKYAGNIPVWLDMEDSRFTDFTLDFYVRNRDKYDLGICLQANLKRTEGDLNLLIRLSGNVKVRLVKGIYRETKEISVTDQKELHRRFLKLIKHAFEKSPESLGVAIGSHHPEAIELALNLQKKHKKKFFEIQVLKGVLPEYYNELRSRRVKVVEYVPYGKEAFAYSVRRARKNPSFARSLLFSIFFDAYKKLYG